MLILGIPLSQESYKKSCEEFKTSKSRLWTQKIVNRVCVAKDMDWVAHGPEGLLLSMEEVRSLLLRSVNFKFSLRAEGFAPQ